MDLRHYSRASHYGVERPFTEATFDLPEDFEPQPVLEGYMDPNREVAAWHIVTSLVRDPLAMSYRHAGQHEPETLHGIVMYGEIDVRRLARSMAYRRLLLHEERVHRSVIVPVNSVYL